MDFCIFISFQINEIKTIQNKAAIMMVTVNQVMKIASRVQKIRNRKRKKLQVSNLNRL